LSALTPFEQIDRLADAQVRARRAFWVLVSVLGALVCTYVALTLAGDPTLPAPLNLIVFLLLTESAVAVLAVRLWVDARLGQLEILRILDGRLEGPTQPLRIATSAPVTGTVVDTRARAEVVQLTDRINRRLAEPDTTD